MENLYLRMIEETKEGQKVGYFSHVDDAGIIQARKSTVHGRGFRLRRGSRGKKWAAEKVTRDVYSFYRKNRRVREAIDNFLDHPKRRIDIVACDGDRMRIVEEFC